MQLLKKVLPEDYQVLLVSKNDSALVFLQAAPKRSSSFVDILEGYHEDYLETTSAACFRMNIPKRKKVPKFLPSESQVG
ncbi:UNVERIFIED_CONTAM: hypothetical protein PYX00_009966 [Menopon gallinae]|uniref:Uncharacterized protein n=1 Tax=Menopon gallinae TaxID=328185 RepID=A0AAW2HDJ1_9NEOP